MMKKSNDTRLRELKRVTGSPELSLKNVLDYALEAVFIIDREGILVYANRKVAEITGFETQELVGKHYQSPGFFSGRDLSRIKRYLMRNLRGESTGPSQFELTRKDGQKIGIEFRGNHIEQDGNSLAAVFFSDIREQGWGEEAFWESKEFATSLLDNTPNSVIAINPDSSIAYANAAFEKLTGFTLADIAGVKPPYPWWPEEYQEEIGASLNETIAQGGRKKERIFQKKDGSRIWVEVKSAPVMFNGEMKYFLVDWTDITERKKMEKALADEATRRRILVEQSRDGIVILDEDGQVYEANRRFAEMLGYTHEETLKLNVWDWEYLYPPEQVKEMIRTVTEEGDHFETKHRRKDSSTYDVEISTNGATFAGQKLIFCVCRDITERKRMENELREHRDHLEELVLERTDELSDTNRRLKHELEKREKAEKKLRQAKNDAVMANRTKSEFLARTSHEIRTPIHGVMGLINLVLDGRLEQDQRQYLKMAMASAESLLNIINDILDLSKIEAGQIEPENIDFDLRTTLEDTMETMAVSVFRKGLEFTCRIPQDIPTTLVGDGRRLRQILVNLIGNASKYTDRGEIALSVEAAAGTGDEVELHFAVRDTGIGIPADRQDIIFEPFQQADGSINRQYGGTGLGLTISQHLIKGMEGRIWVESTLGKGSTFHFTGKFKKQPAAKKAATRPEIPASLRGTPVLLVDDNASSREITGELLSGRGLRVTLVESGAAALEKLKKAREGSRPFQLVFIDKNMPAMNGFELAQRILKSPAPPAVVMVLPPDAISNDFHRCQELGLSQYVVKPIREAKLYEVVLQATGLAPKSRRIPSRAIPTDAGLHLNILVAEDNATSQLIAKKTLEKMGHTVAIAGNGSEAARLVEKNNFDLVLMDAEMPIMNGLEATRYIRKKERDSGRHIPIIAMTAYAMKVDQNRCLEAGMDGYISKPAKPDDINQVIKDLFPEKNNSAVPAVDIDAAMEVFGGDDELLREAAGVFLEQDYPEQIAIIKDGIKRRDALKVKAAAHSVKGAARSLGGLVLGEVALRLEEAGRNGDLTNVPELVEEMEIEVKRFTDFFVAEKDA
jgi:two-component system sensor histidine kinase/response regulator